MIGEPTQLPILLLLGYFCIWSHRTTGSRLILCHASTTREYISLFPVWSFWNESSSVMTHAQFAAQKRPSNAAHVGSTVILYEWSVVVAAQYFEVSRVNLNGSPRLPNGSMPITKSLFRHFMGKDWSYRKKAFALSFPTLEVILLQPSLLF